MLNYSELSEPQKILIIYMKLGYELQKKHGEYFLVSKQGFTMKIWNTTAISLLKRHFIKACYFDELITVYCVNIEIMGLPDVFTGTGEI